MARSPEDALHFPLGETLPLPGRTLEVAPGVRWARMALPFALDHINVWMLRDRLDGRDGWTLVDCGIANDDTRTRWDAVLTHELQGLPVLRVVATHMHPDHVGLAQWLTERASVPGHPCRLWMSAADYQTARMAMAGPVLSDRDRREFVGMVTEKQLAFSQAWVAMFTEGARLQQQLLSAALMGATPAALGRKSRAGISRVASKGLSPVHSKAVSNAKRLGKTKPR